MGTDSIKVISWNIAKRASAWKALAEMAGRGDADLALLQEAGVPPSEIASQFGFQNDALGLDLFDRWPLVVALSDRVKVESFKQVPANGGYSKRELGVSGIGTLAAARVVPHGSEADAFIAVSMYARWMRAHPTTGPHPRIHADISVHRILSDMQTFIDSLDPSKYRILAAGDLNIFYGADGSTLSWPERERLVWQRFDSLGLVFLGPQAPNGRPSASAQPDVPAGTLNVPTYRTNKQTPAEANRQLDYVFASRGFHERIKVRALNRVEEWGPSDHCRLSIEIDGQ